MNRIVKVATLCAAATAGLHAARAWVRSSRNFPWEHKRVLITGGSRGLGLVLGRELAHQGARLAICARTQDQLNVAAHELRSLGAEVIAQECDVRESEQVNQFVNDVVSELGGIDVLINAAGVITVGPLDAMTMDDFENSMQTNCWGALRLSFAVLPHMRRQGWGRIVNVASLGGKRSVPHMLPYAASKFALVGLSNGMRSELYKENIFVTTACPGLMRTGSPRNASFKGRHREEYAWFAVGDSIPPMAMSAEVAAMQILNACQDGRGEVFIHSPMNLTIHFQQLFPELTRELLALSNYMLPNMGGIGKQAAKGFQSESRWAPSVMTILSQRAAINNNEL